MKLFSIIVPVYNAETTLEACVRSFYSQGYENSAFEVLLVNDGSVDGSMSLMEKLSREYGNIVLLSQKNKGQGCARNRAIKVSQGKYLFFCDSDDKFINNSLGRIIELMERYSLEICGSIAKEYDANGNVRFGLLQPLTLYEVLDGISAILNGMFLDSVCSKCYLRSFIVNNNLTFNENIAHEDSLFNAEAIPFAKRMMFTDICTYQYNWNENSTDRSRSKKRIMRGLRSDIVIAKRLRWIPQEADVICDARLADNYKRRSNSIMLSLFLGMLFRKDLSTADKQELQQFAKEENLFPFHGKCVNWKSTIVSKVLNLIYD